MRAHPQDWPRPGPIDLGVHDLPHRSSAVEWWYVNCHLETGDARKLSLFAAFFRIIRDKDEQGLPRYAHSLTWAISDVDGRVYHAESRVDPAAPEMGLQRIADGRGSQDPRLNRAMKEILDQGRVPRPDRIFEGPVHVDHERLALDFGGARFEKVADGRYQLSLANDQLACALTFELQKPPHRHGDDGVVRGAHGEDMFYYFIPRCAVTGSVTLDGEA